MNSIPTSEELAAMSGIPIGFIIQPFAELGSEEYPVPLVDFGEKGPLRCERCRGYINTFCSFTNGGNKFRCNLCRYENVVPSEYFSNLDMTGKRIDFEQRPELRYGTVDYVAPPEYCNKAPAPATILFGIDVSWNAIHSGMVAKAVSGIRRLLYGPGRTIFSGTKIGILTFDRVVHFYNLKPSLEQPQMIVVADIDDVFIPLNEGLLVDPVESRYGNFMLYAE
jgi:protein transport protein SEC24